VAQKSPNTGANRSHVVLGREQALEDHAVGELDPKDANSSALGKLALALAFLPLLRRQQRGLLHRLPANSEKKKNHLFLKYELLYFEKNEQPLQSIFQREKKKTPVFTPSQSKSDPRNHFEITELTTSNPNSV
jgi:hypothetical protein